MAALPPLEVAATARLLVPIRLPLLPFGHAALTLEASHPGGRKVLTHPIRNEVMIEIDAARGGARAGEISTGRVILRNIGDVVGPATLDIAVPGFNMQLQVPLAGSRWASEMALQNQLGNTPMKEISMRQPVRKILFPAIVIVLILTACAPAEQPPAADPILIADTIGTSVALTVDAQNLQVAQATQTPTSGFVPPEILVTDTPGFTPEVLETDTPVPTPDLPRHIAIEKVTPNDGPIAGGTTVTIIGTDLWLPQEPPNQDILPIIEFGLGNAATNVRYRNMVEDYKKGLLVDLYLQQYLKEKNTEENQRNYFKGIKEKFRSPAMVRISVILVKTEDEAKKLLGQERAGVEVRNAETFAERALFFLNHKEDLREGGRRAREAVLRSQGASSGMPKSLPV